MEIASSLVRGKDKGFRNSMSKVQLARLDVAAMTTVLMVRLQRRSVFFR